MKIKAVGFSTACPLVVTDVSKEGPLCLHGLLVQEENHFVGRLPDLSRSSFS